MSIVFQRFSLSLIVISLLVFAGIGRALAQDTLTAAPAQDAAQSDDEELPEGELAPAAVELDVSKAPLLIQALYQATRETKEDKVLASLQRAKAMVPAADVKAIDDRGRTALHWTVFGSSYSKSAKVLVAYEEIADALIQRGIDINKQDMYQDTALDYLLYSPSFEMQTLLIEHGASSGFLAASYQFLRQQTSSCSDDGGPKEEMPQVVNADLSPGLTLSLRLDTAVYSDRSRTGDPIEATVTYPLCKTGEDVHCKPGELLIAPGTKVNGTVLFAQKAPNKYSRPILVLDFSNIFHKEDKLSPLYAHVLDVDNARETVRNNEILGIIQPHAGKKLSFALMAASAANPFAGYAIKGVSAVYGLSLRREIVYPVGTDVQVQVVRYSMLKEKPDWTGWSRMEVTDSLQQIVHNAPMRTATPGNKPSDPTNLMFIGSQRELIAAFTEAGWLQANDLNVKSALKTATATLRQTGYNDAPVSTLMLQGRPPELVFQKSLNTFAKRHHLRVWQLTSTHNGRNVWVAAATHDIATTNERGGTKWSHRIDPHVDRERDWVESDLLFIGSATAYAQIDRPRAPKQLSNATGDVIVTDGKMSVVELAKSSAPEDKTVAPTLSTRPSE
ncbi:MAG TPA: LssY C-terminal domain-containing protein [Terriglobales bacterium]|jgi:LssY C-terminus|nr:LssY C-terminal domain-containing protein [Terriglobales bacterium]